MWLTDSGRRWIVGAGLVGAMVFVLIVSFDTRRTY
jgi:hypothetical protein